MYDRASNNCDLCPGKSGECDGDGLAEINRAGFIISSNEEHMTTPRCGCREKNLPGEGSKWII